MLLFAKILFSVLFTFFCLISGMNYYMAERLNWEKTVFISLGYLWTMILVWFG